MFGQEWSSKAHRGFVKGPEVPCSSVLVRAAWASLKETTGVKKIRTDLSKLKKMRKDPLAT